MFKPNKAKSRAYPFCLLLTICIMLSALAGCATVPIDRLEKTKRELSSDLKITRLPLSVKLAVDDNTKNWSVSKRPSTFAGSANIITVPVGKQFMKGIKHATKLVFQNATESDTYNSQAILEIKIIDFSLEWQLVILGFQDGVEYKMTLNVQSKLIKNDGSIIYQETHRVTNEAVVGIGLFHGISIFHETLSEGNAILTSLWVRKFVQDITEDQEVLRFAESVAGVVSIAELPGPEIIITEPLDGTSTEREEITLSGSIRSDSPLKERRISLNGRPLAETRGISIIPQNAKQTSVSRKIKLPLGENIITITAVNQAGGSSQKVIRITRIEPSLLTEAALAQGFQMGKRWAVVVGISKYKNSAKGIPELKNAAEDARRFAEFLESPKGGGFGKKNVLLLTDEQATSVALRRALFTFLKKAIEEDLVIFFYSGQGAPEPGNLDNYYLLTNDADPEDLPGTAIPTWDVDIAFQRNIKARRAVLLVDACHVCGIGNEAGSRSVGGGNLINKYLKKLSEAGEGKAIFTASQEGQTAVESRLKGRKTGLFTHYLLEALSGAGDENGDGVVSLGEAIDYTIDLVSAASRGKQHPEVAGKFDRNLPLAILK